MRAQATAVLAAVLLVAGACQFDGGAAELEPLSDPTGFVPCPDDPTLVACYRFEGNANDDSSYDNDATPESVSYGSDPGREGSAVILDDSSRLPVSESNSLDVTALTIDVWVRADELPASGRAGLFDNDSQYGLFIQPGGAVRCTGGGAAAVTGAATISAGVWIHIACVYDPTTEEMILHAGAANRAEASGSGAISSNGNNGSMIGGDSPSGDRLVGRLDNLRVWNRVLSAEEICAAAGQDCP